MGNHTDTKGAASTGAAAAAAANRLHMLRDRGRTVRFQQRGDQRLLRLRGGGCGGRGRLRGLGGGARLGLHGLDVEARERLEARLHRFDTGERGGRRSVCDGCRGGSGWNRSSSRSTDNFRGISVSSGCDDGSFANVCCIHSHRSGRDSVRGGYRQS